MALQVTEIKRQFTYTKDKKEIQLADPNPDMTPEQVVKFYSTQYPELTNSVTDGPKIVGDKATYSITTKAGKLG